MKLAQLFRKKIAVIVFASMALSFVLFPIKTFGQKRSIDSLRKLIPNAPDTQKVRLYIRLSFLFNRMDADSSFSYAQKAITLSEKTKEPKLIAAAELQLAVHLINKAQYTVGITNGLKAFDAFEKTKDYEQASYAANVIGNGYMGGGYPTLALQWYKTSLSYGEKSNNEYKIAVALFGIGNTEYDLKQYDSAFVHFKRCETLFIKLGKTREAISVTLTRAKIIYDKEMYYESLQMLLNTQQEVEKLDDIYMLGNFYAQTGDCYRELKKYKQALADQFKALHLFLQINSGPNIIEVYNGIAKTHYAAGNGDSAYYYSSLYIKLNDSIFTSNNSNRIAELQAKFDDADRDKQMLQNDILLKEKQADLKEQANQKTLLLIGLGMALILAYFSWRSYRRKRLDNLIIASEKKKSDELLLNILPAETADELKQYGSVKARNFEMVTVIFTDFKDFTSMSEKLSAEQLVSEINEAFSGFDTIMQKYGVEKIKTIGDAYMAVGGLPTSNSTHAIDVVSAAIEIAAFVSELKKSKKSFGFEIRIGIHSGPVVAGIVGIRKFAYDVWGDTVNTASRIESCSEVGKINISASTYELVKHQFNCTFRGKINAKGKGDLEMYFVEEKIK